jgi:hypothetical protein
MSLPLLKSCFNKNLITSSLESLVVNVLLYYALKTTINFSLIPQAVSFWAILPDTKVTAFFIFQQTKPISQDMSVSMN